MAARGVVGGVDVEDGARRRAGGAGVRARGDDLRKHHTGFLLNGRGVGVDVNPPDAAVVGVALCFRCLGSCSMAPIVTGCIAQRRTPVGLSLVDRGAVFQAAAAWRPLWP